MARPDTHPGVEGGGTDDGNEGVMSTPAGDARPGTGVVRPGTGVVRPGTGVVRPGAAVPDASTAKASAAVPDAPERPLEPIHVVLPVIPVMPAKQGFLDRLVAPKPKKTDADVAEEEAERLAEEARKVEEARRKAEEAQRRAEDAQRKADEKARKTEEESRRAEADAEAKAEARAEAKAEEKARKAEEKARKSEERTRRAEAKAREKEREDEDDDEDDYEDYEDEPVAPRGLAGPMAPPRPGPPPPGPMAPPGPPPGQLAPGPMAPPRPGPPSAPTRPPTRPGPGSARPYPPAGPRPQRAPDRRVEVDHDVRPAPRPKWHWAAAAVALIALGSGSAAITGAAAPPATVQFAEGIDIGTTTPILDDALSTSAPVPTRGGLQAAIGPLLADSSLGSRVGASIVDVATGDALLDYSSATPITPASSAKLLTAAAVLQARGPNFRIATRVVTGSSPGEVVIIGGGDPTLGSGPNATYRGAARLDLLAEQVRKALNGTAPSRVLVDSTLYVGSTVAASWASADVNSGVIANITALMTDGARVNPRDTRSNPEHFAQPDVAAGQIFAQWLGLPPSAVGSGSAPPNAKVLGEVLSPPIARLVEFTLVDSDNVVAEGLARQVALAKGMPASFDGGAAATKTALADLGVPSPGSLGLVDGSGLSDDNKVSPAQLTAILTRAASTQHPQLRPILSGLPVAGYSGTLSNRTQGASTGTVRAKTGTLNHVNALAGYVVDADGRLLAFAAVADATNNRGRAENALDGVAAGIAACGCR